MNFCPTSRSTAVAQENAWAPAQRGLPRLGQPKDAVSFATLFVCFNLPLARMLHDELADAPAPTELHVTTFRELCLTLGRDAGTLPMPEPAEKTQEWWDVTLPRAVEAAIPVVEGRYHAIVVDDCVGATSGASATSATRCCGMVLRRRRGVVRSIRR